MAWAIAYTLLGDFLRPIVKEQSKQRGNYGAQLDSAQWFNHCRLTSVSRVSVRSTAYPCYQNDSMDKQAR